MTDCEDVLTQSERCAFSQEECGWVFQLYFCALDEHWLSWPLLALFFVLGIYLLSSTADLYFSQALSEIAEKFSISPSLAGVTLLAFGNGAPDVFSSILAAHHLHIFLSLGSLAGAGLFVTAVVLARVIFVSKDPQFSLKGTARDIILYTVVLCLLLVYGLIGEITLGQAIVFPVLYLAYVGLVVYMDKPKKTQVLLANVEMNIVDSSYMNLPEIIENYIEDRPKPVFEEPQGRFSTPHNFYSSVQWSYLKFRYFVDRS